MDTTAKQNSQVIIPDQEVAGLIRGFFATPVISTLGRLGVLTSMLQMETFGVDYFEHVSNKQLLQYVFDYLCAIGLLARLEKDPRLVQLTPLGREVFRRTSSFYVPHSYGHYMDSLYEGLTTDSQTYKHAVERAENVTGSGQTHKRYFIPATSYLKRRVDFDVLVDVGCGDGQFIREVLRCSEKVSCIGVDCSKVSVEMTAKKCSEAFPERSVKTILSDAAEVTGWVEPIKKITRNKNLVFSMWFLLHEISRNESQRIIDFLTYVQKSFPQSFLIIGEIVRHPFDVLSAHRQQSLMPEYLFFHDLSGQGILSWEEFQHILSKIPYDLDYAKYFDELAAPSGGKIPTALVWCLKPKPQPNP